MRAVVQRVSRAAVVIDGQSVGAIAHGLLILLGVTHTDTDEAAAWLADKIISLRIFSDADGKMNRSVADVGGGVYEQTIQMAADGRDIVSFVSLLRSPNFAVVGTVKSLKDLRGKTAGVSSVGSPSQFYLNYLLTGAGVSPGDVSTANIGQGATAAAALERNQVDAATLFGSSVEAYLSASLMPLNFRAACPFIETTLLT